MPRVQGAGGLFFAGGWTFVDAHEFAIMSGLAAAERLGAPYPFAGRPCERIYRGYLRSVHGVG
jgi:predicted NAD/FAD-binding protein